MSAQPADLAAVLAPRKCCGKCRRYYRVDQMRRKSTPAGGVIYLCDHCAPPAAVVPLKKR